MELATSSSSSLSFRCIFSSKKTKNLCGFRRLTYPHGVSDKCPHFRTPSSSFCNLKMASSAAKMVSNNLFRGRDSNFRFNSNNVYTKIDSCLVIPPTPNRPKPRAIIKFLGGAFIGAVPEVTYGYTTFPINFNDFVL